MAISNFGSRCCPRINVYPKQTERLSVSFGLFYYLSFKFSYLYIKVCMDCLFSLIVG